jgi:membrane fusion protein, multidrug efflux system
MNFVPMIKNQILTYRVNGLVALVAALSLLTGCGQKHEVASLKSAPILSVIPVRVIKAESKKLTSHEEVVGTVRAKLHATIEAKLSGRIDQMPVRLGQKVKAGQLIASLNAAEIQARLEHAQAALQQAEREWNRAKALFDQQAATRSEYDAADSRYLLAKAGLAEARAMLGYVEIHAPFDSVVTRKWVDVGDLASPGKALVELEDPAVLQLEADIPETIANRVQLDAHLAILVEGITNGLTGTVSEIAPTVDSTSRTLRVKLDLPDASPVRSGQFARLVVPVGESNSIRVPASAVLQRGQLEVAFAVTNQTAQLHLVKTGRRVGNEVEIISGLDAGDQVVIEGAAQLVDNQPVKIQ